MKRLVLGLMAAVVAATPLYAQENAELEKLRAGMSASAYAALSAELRTARERGLPTEPLVSKALEGAAKNVPGDRIVIAVQQTSQRLGRAQVLLRGETPPNATDLTAVAEQIGNCMGGKRDRRAAIFIAREFPDRILGHTSLHGIRHGVPLAVGMEVVGAWHGNGADPGRLKEIPAAVERLVRQGVVPARAGSAIAAGFKLGRRPASIGPGDVPGLTRKPK